MAFCPYCGNQVNDGEVCSCTLASAPRPQPSFTSAPAGSYPPPPPAPKAASYAAPQPEPIPASEPAAPQPGGYMPPQPGVYDPQAGVYTPPAGGYDPQRGVYDPQPGVYNPPAGGYDPQRGVYDPQPGVYNPYGGYTAPRAPSAFAVGITNLLNRAKMLFSSDPNAAVRDALNATDLSWSVVFGVYVLFGALAASFALGCALMGGVDTLFRFAPELFGGSLWRAMLINLLTLGIALGAVMAVSAICKNTLPISKALNLVSFAYLPAAAMNVLGMLFALFFPFGTLLLALLSSVMTLAILCLGLAEHCRTNSLWLHFGTSSSVIVAYFLIVYLFMFVTFSQLANSLF